MCNSIAFQRLFVVAALLVASTVHGVESMEVQLKQIADETRKSLPMKLNENLQATNIASVGKIMISRFNFLLIKSELPDLKTLKAGYYESAVNAVCTTPQTLKFINNGMSAVYQYYDLNDEFIMEYKIGADICRLKNDVSKD